MEHKFHSLLEIVFPSPPFPSQSLNPMSTCSHIVLTSHRINGYLPGKHFISPLTPVPRECQNVKAPVKSSPTTNQHSFFTGRMPFLSFNQECQSTEGKKCHIPWTCLPQAHLWVFQLCLWPLIAPGYLGEGCHASHQPSDAIIPRTSFFMHYKCTASVEST